MTKKDFELIARALEDAKPPWMGQTAQEAEQARAQWDRQVVVFANALQVVNPSFDRARFLKACGAPS